VINGLTTLGQRWRQSHGAGRRPAGRRHHRYSLAEEPDAHHQQGLCQPDLSWLAAAASTEPGRAVRAKRQIARRDADRPRPHQAPEDVILDRNDNLYAGSRHGDIIRFLAPDYQQMEVFAHIGGQPLGMAFDRADNL
jgi:hypothetical protein